MIKMPIFQESWSICWRKRGKRYPAGCTKLPMIDLDLADDEAAEEEDAEDSTTLLIPITGTVAAEVAVQVEEEAVAEVEEEVQEEVVLEVLSELHHHQVTAALEAIGGNPRLKKIVKV